ncbi:MAG: DUF805 domain-containing protein [Maritimibacter sp.]|nr:DUF805 domain-containing protein [Maritimibacter sp.]
MGFLGAIGICFRKYVSFSGRAARAEYWWWTLFLIVGSLLYGMVAYTFLSPLQGADLETFSMTDLARIIAIGWGFWIVTILPTLAVTVRRLHDTGRTGGWIVVPWILNAASLYGAMIARPEAMRALGLDPIKGDPWLGGALMYGAGLVLTILSLNMLIWMLKAGTRGDNYYGPDPRGGDASASYSEDYAAAYGTPSPDPAAAAATQRSHREEVAALYQQRVLGRPAG